MAETKTNIQYLDMEGLSLYDSLLKAKIANDIKASEYDDAALKTRVTANETAIGVLNGEGEGSVKKQVDDAVARIVADAPEAYNTLKEISDWISSHADSAAAMNSQITTNKNDIVALKALVSELPESAESATIVEYIEEVVGASLADAKTYTDSVVKALADGQVTVNKEDIATLQDKVETLESITYTPITKEEIDALFTDVSETTE